MFMKKNIVAVVLISLTAIVVFMTVMLKFGVLPSEEASTVAETEVESKTAYIQKPSTDINVDSWLKISEITEYNGRLAVVAENISGTDVEYAVLTVKNGNETYSFNASVLLRNTKVMLMCNENVGFDADAVYTLWKTENILNFATPPSMNEDVLEISVLNGSVSVKNISGKDIDSDILICYKDNADGIPNGSVTRRIRLSGLAASAKTFVNAPELNENNCTIMFTQY